MNKCIIDGCAEECVPKRRYCRKHYLERKRAQAKENYDNGKKHTYEINCRMCNKLMKASRKTQKFCMSCYKKLNKSMEYEDNTYENANKKKYIWKHRYLAENAIGRKLWIDEVVHHIDCDRKNNSIDNLMILSREDHAKLHSFLRANKFIAISNHTDDKFDVIGLTNEWINSNSVPHERL